MSNRASGTPIGSFVLRLYCCRPQVGLYFLGYACEQSLILFLHNSSHEFSIQFNPKGADRAWLTKWGYAMPHLVQSGLGLVCIRLSYSMYRYDFHARCRCKREPKTPSNLERVTFCVLRAQGKWHATRATT